MYTLCTICAVVVNAYYTDCIIHPVVENVVFVYYTLL